MSGIGISLCGAHRTGKTTLADAFAQHAGIAFVQTGVSQVFEVLGKDPKADYPIDERLAIQEAILYALEKQIAMAAENCPVFIADRCPIDLASYLIADVQRGSLAGEPVIARMVNDYVRRCLEATNRWFATVVMVQPGIALVEASGKAPACPAYVEHLNLLQSGLLLDERLHTRHYQIPRRYLSLQQRIRSVERALAHAVEATEKLHSLNQKAGLRQH